MDIERFLSRQTTRFLKDLLKEGTNPKKPRRGFSKSVKKQVLIRQDYLCNVCHKLLDIINFDHVDGNRSNNSLYNCQGLCPNCHAKKTRKK